MPVTILDMIVIGVVLISALLAALRGFHARGAGDRLVGRRGGRGLCVPSPGDSAGAAVCLAEQGAACAGGAGGIFLVTLLVAYFITSKLSDMILDSRIGALDRTLGFAFARRAACCSPSSASCSSPGSPRTSGTTRSGCATPS